MKFLLFKRSWCLALVMLIIPFSNVSFAESNAKNYDTKRLIRDAAVLYRKHKLAEATHTEQSTLIATAIKIIEQDIKTITPSKKTISTVDRIKQARHKKAKKRKASRLAKAKKLLKSRKQSKPYQVAKARRHKNDSFKRQMTVTATAYTSHENQTDSTPNIAAWGDRLHPGMKAIAVSRDMLKVYGLKHRSKVRIKGLDGEYLVLDKMNKRWKKKIDIYMGKDLKKAFKWGRKKVELQWN